MTQHYETIEDIIKKLENIGLGGTGRSLRMAETPEQLFQFVGSALKEANGAASVFLHLELYDQVDPVLKATTALSFFQMRLREELS